MVDRTVQRAYLPVEKVHRTDRPVYLSVRHVYRSVLTEYPSHQPEHHQAQRDEQYGPAGVPDGREGPPLG